MSTPRPSIVGPDSGPEPPYPYTMEGKVIKGFGRGSKELGIPTANLPVDTSLTPWIESIPSGVYFGYASLQLPDRHPQKKAQHHAGASESESDPSSSSFDLFPMVMSIGYNPFYKNTVRSAEVHVLHAFEADFYGAHMRLLILGFIREERDYESLGALVEDIETDCRVARASLERGGWRAEAVRVKGEGEGNDSEGNGAEWLARKL
ncbi:riboflavin kinase [Claviceps lovelessii]|nr:riboflavin kinase [Claviceps lovelessii]